MAYISTYTAANLSMDYFVSNDDHRGASQTSYFGSGGHGTCSVGLERLLEMGLFEFNGTALASKPTQGSVISGWNTFH